MSARLPKEILDHVLSLASGVCPTWVQAIQVHTASEDGNPNATLLSAALVSKAWAESAQRALYRHAIFPMDPEEDNYRAWINSDARRRHRTVSIWVRPCYAEIFREFMESFEGLESLDLGGMAYLPRDLEDEEGQPLLAWDVLTSTSLKEDVMPIPELSATLPIVAPTIRHLILDIGGESLEDGLQHFNLLQHLELPSASPDDGWPLRHESFVAALATLPDPLTLRHLTLGIERGGLLEQLANELESPKLQGLETLELSKLRRSDLRSADEETLVATRERRSIALVYADGKVW
ncbi:hypothetical protein RQP46_002593 [Phenoliferia psychrophenolica]